MVVPAVLDLYRHVTAQANTLKFLTPTSRALRDSFIKRFVGVFARVGMAYADDLDKAPFGSKLYFLAAMLDPNYKLFWIDDLVVSRDEEEDDTVLKATAKAQLMSKKYD